MEEFTNNLFEDFVSLIDQSLVDMNVNCKLNINLDSKLLEILNKLGEDKEIRFILAELYLSKNLLI